MATTSPDVDRKVRQLDNDVHEIYEMLRVISHTQGKHCERLDTLATEMSRVGGTQSRHLSTIEKTLAEHGERFDTIGLMLGKHGEQLDGIIQLLQPC
ncbi:MAG TPA: hypothetical protein VF444_15475 [Pseudonocardiaceae bacterium]